MKQKYDPKNLKALDYPPVKIETKPLSDENKSEIKQPTHKPLWFEIDKKKEFEELTGDIYNNQDNNNFKIIIKLL